MTDDIRKNEDRDPICRRCFQLVRRYANGCGHEIMFGPFGHVPTAVAALIKDGIDGVLILTDDDENLKEIAARFARETGRPVWRDLTEIPR